MIARFLAAINSLSKTERRTFYISASVFFVTLIVLSLNIYFWGTRIEPDRGGLFIEGMVGQPSAINPIVSSLNDVDRDLIQLMFSDLLSLSTSYEHSEDGKEWQVILQNGLFWSDGSPLTIEDVIFTINLIQNRELASPLFSSWKGVEVAQIDDKEILFTLSSAYSYFENTLRNLRPIPEHIFASVPAANLRLSNFNLEPVASGPYMFDEIERNKDGFISEYKLKENPHYYGEEIFIPNFKIRFFKYFKDALGAFNRKTITGLGGFDQMSLQEIKTRHELFNLSIPRYYAVFFNQSEHEALKDLEVRQALVLATDKKELNDKLFDGAATISYGPLLPYIEAYDEEIYSDSKSSKREAREILEEAGWVMNENDILAKNDVLLEFDLIIPDIDFLMDTADLLAEQWQKVGITLNPIILNPAVISNEIIRTRDYQMILFGNILRGNPDIFSFWHSTQRFHPGLNLALYNDNKVDSALELSRGSFDDEERNLALQTIQEKIFNDAPANFLYSPPYFYAVSRPLGGFNSDILTTASDRFENIINWHLKTRRALN